MATVFLLLKLSSRSHRELFLLTLTRPLVMLSGASDPHVLTQQVPRAHPVCALLRPRLCCSSKESRLENGVRSQHLGAGGACCCRASRLQALS